jgi:hypothetical protein
MQQVQIPIPPVANVSRISASQRKVCAGRNSFHFLHSSSQWGLVWAFKVSTVMPVQHVPICAATCDKIFILLLIGSDLCFPLLSIFHPLAVKFILVYTKIWYL